MSKKLTLQQIMEDDSISLLELYESNNDVVSEQAARVIPYLARAAARAASRGAKSAGKVVSPQADVGKLAAIAGARTSTAAKQAARSAALKGRDITGRKLTVSDRLPIGKGMTKVSPLSKPGELAKTSKLPTKAQVKAIGKTGTDAEKASVLDQVVRMRMAGALLDGEFGSYIKMLGVQWVMGKGMPFLATVFTNPVVLSIIAAIIASAAGVGVGYAVNKALYDDFEGEALERIKKAMANEEYAKAELDLYCRGTGKLCSSQGGPTKCISKSKSSKNPFVGGYRYETAGSERLGRVITPGSIGDGREKSTEAQRKIDDVGKDLAKKYGTAGAVAGSALATLGTPVFLGSKIAAKIAGDTGDLVVYVQQPAFDSRDLAVIAGIGNAIVQKDIASGKIKYDAASRKMEVGGNATIKKYENCLKALLNSGFAKRALGKFSWLSDNYQYLQLALGLTTFKQLKQIRKADQIKQKKAAAVIPATPVGPKLKKCNNYPMEVGCKGSQVATTLAILTRGTKKGKELYDVDPKTFNKLYDEEVYTPELKEFFELVLKSIDDQEYADITAKLNTKYPNIKDTVKDTPQKIANDFAKNKGKIIGKSQLDFLLTKIAMARDVKLTETIKKLKLLIQEALEEELELINEELLTEGGAGGHMRHPFDLDDVKTGEDLIKKFEQIGSEIQGGNTPDTKIDGVNASIKVIDGPEGKEFAIDRGGVSKDDVQGISKSRLVTRFQDFIGIKPEIDGKSEVREQRIIAKIQPDGTRVPYNWLEKSNPDSPKIAVGDKVIYKKTKVSPEEEVEITSIRPHGMRTGGNTLLSIFNDALPEIEGELKELGLLDDPSKFFNMEFVKTGVNNVLNYDHNFLKIHGVNQFYEKTNRGKPARSGLERPEGVHDPSVPVDYDKEVMDRMVEKINKFSDKYDFKVYSYIPSKATGEFDFKPVLSVPVPVTYSKDNVEEANLGQRLDKAVNRIGEMVELKSGRTIPVQGKEIYQAVLGTSAEDTNADPARQTPLDELLANEKDYQKAIDGAVFWHATRLMGNVIMNNMVVDHPAVKGPATDHEGLVIKLAGDDFGTKITGEFILGGEATSFRKPANADSKVEKEVEYKNIAIFPGSFKPPHKGHLSVIERVAENPEVDEIKVIISAPGKKVRSLKITPEKAKDIFEKFISSSNIDKPVSVEISNKPSPITAAYDYIGEKAGPNENVLLLTSEADSKRYPQESLDKYAGMNKNAETLTVKGLVLPVCKDEGCQTTDKISATTIRNIVDAYPDITLDELTKAVDHMPDSMSTADKLAAFEMLVDDRLSNKFEDEELNTLNESVRFIMETIDKALDVVLLTEKVRKTRGKKEYCVVSKKKKTKKGKLRKYGCYKSRKAANKRLGQVEGFKARAMAEGDEVEEYQIVEFSGVGAITGYAGPLKDS